MIATASPAEINRINAQKSTGPRTEAGKNASRENALKHGLSGRGVVLPEEMRAEVDAAIQDWTALVRPTNRLENELIQTISLTAVQGNRASWLELAVSQLNQENDLVGWESQRDIRAAKLGSLLEREPQRAVAELNSFSNGCDYLILRLRALAGGLKRDACTWTPADLARLLYLEGLPQNEHETAPRAVRFQMLYKQAVEGNQDAVRALRQYLGRRIRVLRGDAEMLRSGIEQMTYDHLSQGLIFDMSPVAIRLRRMAATAWRRYDAAMRQLKVLRPHLFQPGPATAATSPPPPAPGPAPTPPAPPERKPATPPSAPPPPAAPSATAAPSAGPPAPAPTPLSPDERAVLAAILDGFPSPPELMAKFGITAPPTTRPEPAPAPTRSETIDFWIGGPPSS